MSEWKVGQEVVVNEGSTHGGTFAGVVTKIARKYFTVAYTRSSNWETTLEFQISNGHERVSNPQYPQYSPGQCYTPERWEAKKYRDSTEKRLREDHRAFGDPAGTMNFNFWDDGEILELVELLDRVKARQATKDLDGRA